MKPPITVLDEETVPWLEECNKSRVKTINSTTRTHRIICFSHIRNDIKNYQTPLPLEYLAFILVLLDFAASEMLTLVNKYLFHAFVKISPPVIQQSCQHFYFSFFCGHFFSCSSKSSTKTGSQKVKIRTIFISEQRVNGLCFQWHIKKSTWGILMLYRNADMQRIINVNWTFHN